MQTALTKEYRRQRAKGWNASTALRNAKVERTWNVLEARGKVALKVMPDDDCDLSYLDQDCFAHYRKAELERANRDGCWGLVGEYRCPRCGQWTTADSIWGFIGEDWRDSGYDMDVKAEVIDQYLKCCC